MEEPMVRAWIEEPVRPAPFNAEKPGRWVAELRGRALAGRRCCWALRPTGWARTAAARSPFRRRRRREWGRASGAHGVWADQPLDQRRELAGQTVFDTAPLDDDLDTLGTPELTLTPATSPMR